jgi:hypothetical protein
VVLWEVRRTRVALWLALCLFGGLAFLYIVVWFGGYRHYGLVFAGAIAVAWLGLDRPPSRRFLAACALACIGTLPLTVRFIRDDLTRNFSGSREMAEYLIAHGLDDREIAAHPPPHAEAVLPYLRARTFWYAALGERGSYMHWDRAYRIAQATPASVAAKKASDHYRGRDWLFLSAQPLAQPEAAGLKLLYSTHEPLIEQRDADLRPNDERYWLYEHRED